MTEIAEVWTDEGWEREIGRMVVFEDGVKVDFTFNSIADLRQVQSGLQGPPR